MSEPTRLSREDRARVVAWLRLARAYHQIDRASTEFLRRWDLSVAQFDVLAQIGAHEGLTQQELADHLLVTKGNISQLLARMERRGLVRRTQDGRALVLSLTTEGRRLHGIVVPAQEALIAARLAPLDPAALRALSVALRTLDRSPAEE
jgi:DNA-binding MarR family transcriptional regulator